MTAAVLADILPGAVFYAGPERTVRRGADRPAFRDAWTLAAALATGDVVEPKEDGRWAHVRIADGMAVLVSREGREMARIPVAARVRCVLAAEYLIGQPTCRKGSARSGAVVVFDCLERDGADLRSLPLRERRESAAAVVSALGRPFALVPQLHVADCAPDALLADLRRVDGEGVVVKDSGAAYGSSTWVRWKRRA